MKRKHEERIAEGIYREVVLEDFEKLQLPRKNIEFRGAQQSRIIWQAEFPAPLAHSKRYLGWQVLGSGNEVVSIRFPKPPLLSDHCKYFSLWVFGTYLPGELFLMVEDTRSDIHLLGFGTLKFRGWRKLEFEVPDHVVQKDLNLSKPSSIKVLKLVYRPGSSRRLKSWQYFFVDDLTAHVRQKYLLPKKE